jgi:nudix-type nucleoside diphosphatase (YffH/AdpP family)
VRPDEASRVFVGRLVSVTVERWGHAEREIVERPDSVAVVAVDTAGFVVLVRQRREAARKALLELPAGTIDDGEKPIETARRELLEETGCQGGRWRAGPVFWSTPGFCRERIHLFAGEQVEAGGRASTADEEIEVVRIPVAESVARVGELEDGKTIAGLLWYASVRGLEPSGRALS